MTNEPLNLTDRMIGRERRGIAGALLIIVGLLAGAATVWLDETNQATLPIFYIVAFAIPVIIAIALGRMRITRKDLSIKRAIVRADEGRQSAIDRACRYAFVTTLIAMAISALFWLLYALPASVAALLTSFVALGAITFLISFLVLDRAT